MINQLFQLLPQSKVTSMAKQDHGFSLIELLVSIALLGIMGGIGVSIFAVINNSYNTANALSKMQTQGAQVLEVLERSIRSSSDAVVTGNGGGCNNDQCLIITIPSSSIEYSINGGCGKTVYGWTAPTSSVNGQMVRYYLTDNNSQCNGSVPIQLFDTDTRAGVSIRQNGANNIFTANTGAEGIDSIVINMILAEGIAKGANATTIPLRTTVSLRDY